jgi:hypothetical protein
MTGLLRLRASAKAAASCGLHDIASDPLPVSTSMNLAARSKPSDSLNFVIDESWASLFTRLQSRSSGELLREGYWISGTYYGPTPPAGLKVESGTRVKMVEGGGVYYVPVVINDALKLDFLVDSGASVVMIPADVVLTLIRTGTIKESDFVGTQKDRRRSSLDVDPVQYQGFQSKLPPSAVW